VSAPDDDAELVAAVRAATEEDRARLRSALSAVRRTTPASFTWRGGRTETPGVFQMPYPDYQPTVVELVDALGAVHAVRPLDWMHWDGIQRYPDASAVQRAPLADVVRLITAFVRGERFADGTIAAALDDGRLLTAAQRVLDG
jgi:predicted secreted protein